MSEFNNRMEAQRKVLEIVNSRKHQEQLCGLSAKALGRWLQANGFQEDEQLPMLLRTISEKLSFLATRSQEQVTSEYRNLATEVESLTRELKAIIG